MATARKRPGTGSKGRKAPTGSPSSSIAAVVLVVAVLGLLGIGFKVWTSRNAAQRERVAEVAKPVGDPTAMLKRAREILFSAAEDHVVLTADDWSRARKLYESAAAADPESSRATSGLLLTEAGIDLTAHRDDVGVRKLGDVVGNEEEVLAGYALGQYMLQAGKPQDAWGEFGLVLGKRPDWMPAQLGQALADLEMDDLKGKDCPVVHQAAARIEPTATIAAAKARCLGTDNDPAAKDWFAKAFVLGSRDPIVVERHITYLIADGQIDDARRQIDVVTAEAADAVSARINFADALRSAKHYDLAEQQCEAAKQARPGDPGASICLASVITERDRPEDALVSIQELLDEHPTEPRLWLYKGYAQVGIGKSEDAYRTYEFPCREWKYEPACKEACYTGINLAESRSWAACNLLDAKTRYEIYEEVREQRRIEAQLDRNARNKRYQTDSRLREIESRDRRERYQDQRQRDTVQRQRKYQAESQARRSAYEDAAKQQRERPRIPPQGRRY